MSPAPKPARRWLQFGMGAILLAVAIAGVLAWAARPRSFPDRTKPIKDVDVELDGGDFGGSPFRFRLTDPTLIESLIVKPLRDSERDPPPVPAYVVLGTIHVHYHDGTTGGAILFLPWGCWQGQDGIYRKSDLSLLRDESKRLIQTSRPTAPVLNEPAFWSPKPYD
jgi:hypothetical protein